MEEERRDTSASVGRCLVIHPVLRLAPSEKREGARSPEGRLDEAVGLARSINLAVVSAQIVWLRTWRPATSKLAIVSPMVSTAPLPRSVAGRQVLSRTICALTTARLIERANPTASSSRPSGERAPSLFSLGASRRTG